MEKLVYVLWKKPEVAIDDFKTELLDETSRHLIELGTQALSINLADDAAEFARGLRITRLSEPMGGTVSVWMHTALDRGPIEEALSRVTARLAGYLVLESMPIVNTTHVVSSGERTPGICTVAFLEKPAHMTYEAWLDRWQGHHTKVAVETQSTFLYIQNAVVRPVTSGAPPWAAIVEEGFPAEAATDPMVFYDAGGSKEKLERNQRRMFESCKTFIDFSQIESHPMSSYTIKGLGVGG
jgi:hypothetical protein